MSIFDWSLTAASNGNSDATINFSEGQPPSSVNDSARSMMARLAHFRNWLAGAFTQGGASNAYTITSGESLSAYAAGMRFLWKPNAASTGAVTLNIDTIGAKKVYMPAGAQAGSGDISADAFYDVVYVPSLDSANGGFKIVGSPDLTNTSLFLQKASNLSDLANVATAQTNLGYTAADVLAKLVTVDGAGSGLDADKFEGLEGSAYATLAGAQTFTGVKTFNHTGQNLFTGTNNAPPASSGTTQTGSPLRVASGNTTIALDFGMDNAGRSEAWIQSVIATDLSIAYALNLNPRGGVVQIGGKTAARVNSGAAANSGLISWGTSSPGTLAEGEIYLQYDP